MKTYTLSNGNEIHLSEISLKACMEAMKKDFRTMPYEDAYRANKDDIDYIASRGFKTRAQILRALRMTAEFAGTIKNN